MGSLWTQRRWSTRLRRGRSARSLAAGLRLRSWLGRLRGHLLWLGRLRGHLLRLGRLRGHLLRLGRLRGHLLRLGRLRGHLLRLSRLRRPLGRPLFLRGRRSRLVFLLHRRPRLVFLRGRRRIRRTTRSPAGSGLWAGGSPGRLRAPALTSRPSTSGGGGGGRSLLSVGLFDLAVRPRRFLGLGLRGWRIVGSACWRPVLRAVGSRLIPRTRSARALRTRRASALRCTLLPVAAHLDAVGGAVTSRSLGGGLFSVAFTHCHPPGPPHRQIPHSGSRAVFPVLTRARNRPRPRPRSNWNHHPQEPHLQVVPLLLLSRG